MKTGRFTLLLIFSDYMIIEKYVVLGERGQIVIPKEIRDKEGIEPEDRLRVIDLDGELIITVEKKDKKPEIRALELLKHAKFSEKDWKDILRERRKE